MSIGMKTVPEDTRGQRGTLDIRNDDGQNSIQLSGQGAMMVFHDLDAKVQNALVISGKDGRVIASNISVGTSNPSRRLHVHGSEIHSGGPASGFSFGNRQTAAFSNTPGERWVWYSSQGVARLWSGTDKIAVTTDGDIQLVGADCAEDFDVEDPAVEPGTVMVMAEDGRLTASTIAYDSHVAGVVAGAGDYRPGVILDRQEATTTRKPLALVGKAFCRVDATVTPVNTGDLLTTSDVAGHAMVVTDRIRAIGAILGKALGTLTSGRGLVPILVTLQ